jgi:hypothetical protein
MALNKGLIDILFMFINYSHETADLMLTHIPNIITQVDQKGRTLLNYSLIYDNMVLFNQVFPKILMNIPQEHSIQIINHQDQDGYSPLHVAIDRRHIDPIYLLIENGANLNLINNQGMTPMLLAYANNDAEIIERLLQIGVQSPYPQVDEETELENIRQMGIENVASSIKQKQVVEDFPVLSEDQYTAYPDEDEDVKKDEEEGDEDEESSRSRWKCPICQMEDKENKIWAWPCCHAYHIDCLKNWGVKCALCSKKIEGITLQKCNKEYQFGGNKKSHKKSHKKHSKKPSSK